MVPIDEAEFRRRLVMALDAREVQRNQLAELALGGAHASTVSKWVTGKRKPPSEARRRAIERFLDLPATWLDGTMPLSAADLSMPLNRLNLAPALSGRAGRAQGLAKGDRLQGAILGDSGELLNIAQAKVERIYDGLIRQGETTVSLEVAQFWVDWICKAARLDMARIQREGEADGELPQNGTDRA